jgi:hypothetical protein
MKKLGTFTAKSGNSCDISLAGRVGNRATFRVEWDRDSTAEDRGEFGAWLFVETGWNPERIRGGQSESEMRKDTLAFLQPRN